MKICKCKEAKFPLCIKKERMIEKFNSYFAIKLMRDKNNTLDVEFYYPTCQLSSQEITISECEPEIKTSMIICARELLNEYIKILSYIEIATQKRMNQKFKILGFEEHFEREFSKLQDTIVTPIGKGGKGKNILTEKRVGEGEEISQLNNNEEEKKSTNTANKSLDAATQETFIEPHISQIELTKEHSIYEQQFIKEFDMLKELLDKKNFIQAEYKHGHHGCSVTKYEILDLLKKLNYKIFTLRPQEDILSYNLFCPQCHYELNEVDLATAIGAETFILMCNYASLFYCNICNNTTNLRKLNCGHAICEKCQLNKNEPICIKCLRKAKMKLNPIIHEGLSPKKEDYKLIQRVVKKELKHQQEKDINLKRIALLRNEREKEEISTISKLIQLIEEELSKEEVLIETIHHKYDSSCHTTSEDIIEQIREVKYKIYKNLNISQLLIKCDCGKELNESILIKLIGSKCLNYIQKYISFISCLECCFTGELIHLKCGHKVCRTCLNKNVDTVKKVFNCVKCQKSVPVTIKAETNIGRDKQQNIGKPPKNTDKSTPDPRNTQTIEPAPTLVYGEEEAKIEKDAITQKIAQSIPVEETKNPLVLVPQDKEEVALCLLCGIQDCGKFYPRCTQLESHFLCNNCAKAFLLDSSPICPVCILENAQEQLRGKYIDCKLCHCKNFGIKIYTNCYHYSICFKCLKLKITSDKYQFPYSMLCKFCVPRNKSYFDLSVLLLLFNTLKKERVKLKIFYRSHHELCSKCSYPTIKNNTKYHHDCDTIMKLYPKRK